MSKIEKGDMVECIKNFNKSSCTPPVSKGQRFVVNDLYVCSCGASYIDIGLPLLETPKYSYCPVCNKKTSAPLRPFYLASAFSKIEPEYRLVEIETSIKEELKKFNVTEKIDA